MNAINLLPPDLRRGTGAPGRSGIAVYVLLGVLGLAVLLTSLTAVLNGRVADRETALAQAEAEASAAEQRAASVAHYKQLAAQTGQRVDAVRGVAAGRVNWATSLTQLSETIGTKVEFSSLTATSGTGTGGGNALRSGVAAPALEVDGCAENHPAVARMMARFRAMNDVSRVALASSTKADEKAGSEQDGATCSPNLPATFSIVIFLDQGASPSSTDAAGTTTSTGASR